MQWQQAMMSQAYTHHWDEIEYFKLAVPHAEKDEKVAGVKAGCNGCHAPLAFIAGDVPPPLPAENSRANESVSCDVCHTITGIAEETPYNFNFTIKPGRTKYGNREGVESPHHNTEYSDFVRSPELCGSCHNEKSPYGVWVKSTHLEWKEGPYAKEGVRCQDCHMPRAEGRSAKLSAVQADVAQHLFHGAHSQSKLRGSVELRLHPDTREIEPGEPITLKVQAFNHKAGHKIPSGSAEERQLWLTVIAYDSEGKSYHLPVDEKGFPGEEYTISSNVLAYQDMGMMLGEADFKGLPRDALPYEGDRVFRLPYFDPQGRLTIAQWNTASLGTDYRIGPRETKIETYTWEIPDDIAEGKVKVVAEINYRRLVLSVGEYLGVPAEEMATQLINRSETWFEVFY
jgi:nitrate/TMAO reductase-like tetraheme cytochrome c subunit